MIHVFKQIVNIFTCSQQKILFMIFLCMVLGAMMEAVGISAVLPLITILGQPEFLVEHGEIASIARCIGVYTHRQFVLACVIGLIFLYVLKNLYLAIQAKIQINFAMDNQRYYACQLMAGYLNKPYIFHLNVNTATLQRNINSGPIAVFSNMIISFLQLMTEIVTALIIWITIVIVDPFTAIVVAGLLGGLLYELIKLFRKKISEQGVVQNTYMAEITKWVNQSFGAIKETKVARREKYFYSEFGKSYSMYSDAYRVFNFINQLPRLVIEVMVVGALMLLIATKIILGDAPGDIVPFLAMLALAAFRLMPCANRIVSLTNTIKFQKPLFDELYAELMAVRDRRESGEDKVLFDTPGKAMCFKDLINIDHVQYAYPDSSDKVLQDVSFTIPKGKFVGIIGPSGAGKTTFVDILLGVLKPAHGLISVDGQDIFKEIRAWQRNLAYVPQSIYLIDGSIRDNIALGVGADQIDDTKIVTALKMAELFDFVNSLPDGLDTMVGELGVKLSGGQKQRIGIARALYEMPEILILDEATSALDNETEKSITETILKLKGQITIIAIAHRVSTLEECDFKIKFENGRAEVIE